MAIDPVTIAAVGGILNTAGNMVQGRANRKHQKKMLDRQQAFLKAESELAYQRSVEDWHRQNAYNSPEAQMQRLKDAGLNPHLIYGTGSASTGNATQQPIYHASGAPDYQAVQAPRTAVGSIADSLPVVAQVSNWLLDMEAKRVAIDSQRQDMAHNAARYPTIESILGIEADSKAMDLGYQSEFRQLETDKKRLEMMRAIEEFMRDYGADPSDSLYRRLRYTGDRKAGMKDLERVAAELRNELTRVDISKRESEARIQAALASLADMGLTGPMLTLIGLAAGGVTGLGKSLITRSVGKAATKEVGKRVVTRSAGRAVRSDSQADWIRRQQKLRRR